VWSPDGLFLALLDALGALPGILDDDVRRHFPTAAWSQVKLGHLIADDVLGVDAMQLLNGVLDGID
jgi:hypothetical protein